MGTSAGNGIIITNKPYDIFNNHFRVDNLATGLKLVTFITTLIVILGTNTDKLK